MHYCIAIITEQFPTDDVLEKVLAPFNSESLYENCKEDEDPAEYPQFTWDWWQVGGRYDGLLKLKIDREDEEYRWDFYAKEPRAGRLYRSKLCENHLNKTDSYGFRYIREEDYYHYMGMRAGYIRVDGCKVKDVIDFADTISNHGWGFIGRDGTAYSREHWDGKNFVKDEQYEEKVKSAIANVEDCYVCYVDIHD